MPTFADASFYIGIADPKDQWHRAATDLLHFAQARSPLHTHALALAEVIALVGAVRGGKGARLAYESIRDACVLHLPTLDDLDESMRIVVRHDGALSLSDALTLHLMAREGARQVLSFDKDFDGKGVVRVHAPPRR